MYPIPANATRIRYLESTGTQYIDTGYILNTASKIEVSGRFTSTATQQMGLVNRGETGKFNALLASQEGNFVIFLNNNTVVTGISNSGLPDVTYLVDLPDAVAKINSAQGSISSSLITGSFARSFFLFARNDTTESEPSLFCSFKLKSAKFYDGGVLVRDFVPVRVGQTGYLFDRVSGQLFGNAGTGDFVLGPDTFAQGVLPTRMMVAGVRKRLPTTLDYVQDGLYYQLDGIENAGRGVHDATASTWTDLTGNGRNATFINGKTWKNNACYLAGMTSDHMAKIAGLPSMTSFTVEIVHKQYAKENYARLYDSEAYYGDDQSKRFSCLFGTSLYTNSCSFSIGVNEDLNYNLISAEDTSPRSFSVIPSMSGSFASASVYVNGVYVQTVSQTKSRAGTPSSYIDVANRSNTLDRGANMDVYAIRVYNRVLTAAEIDRNYAVDKVRFNLP